MKEWSSAETAIIKRQERSFAQNKRNRDALLDMVARVGRAKVPIAIGLLIDGVIVRGAVVPSEHFAERASVGFAETLQAMGISDQTQQNMVPVFTKLIEFLEEQRKREEVVVQESIDQGWNTFDDIPMDKVIDMVSANRPRDFIELSDVSMEARAGIVKLNAMRVSVDHVAAWWPLESEENANVAYINTPRSVEAGP